MTKCIREHTTKKFDTLNHFQCKSKQQRMNLVSEPKIVVCLLPDFRMSKNKDDDHHYP